MRRAKMLLIFTLLSLIATSCTQRSTVISAHQQSDQQMRADTERAFELERRADLVIDYEWLDRIRLSVSRETAVVNATDDTLAEAVASTTTKRDLAVVILGKPVRHVYEEAELRKKVDEIEAVVKAQGFKRVVFQLASAGGRPIYRE